MDEELLLMDISPEIREIPRIERRIQIRAPPVVIYTLLSDVYEYPKWDDSVSDSVKLWKRKFLVRYRDLGTMTGRFLLRIPFQSLRMKFEGGLIGFVKYRLELNHCLVNLTAEYTVPVPNTVVIVNRIIDVQLNSLQYYAELLSTNGAPVQVSREDFPSYWEECLLEQS